MNIGEILTNLSEERGKDCFKQLYGCKSGVIEAQNKRYRTLVEQFIVDFPGFDKVYLFSTPGRTEVGGNHTDHNAGRVLAAAINLDLAAVVCPSDDVWVVIHSKGYPEIKMNINDLGRREEEMFTPAALVRGVCARLQQIGYKIKGFRASIDGQIPKGSGLSSSAAFEVLIATILNQLFNIGIIDNTRIAQIAQYSENIYFGKPCGLMDQTACAYGGLVYIDFKDFDQPVIEKINYDFSVEGYTVLIIDTGGNHADLNDDYIALENEMKNVADVLGGKVLRDFSDIELMESLAQIRLKVSDRAILRSLHYFNDNERVVKQVKALKSNRINDFLALIKESGESSWMLCQNCYSSRFPESQGISLGLAVTARYLNKGAWRVHGGGFAGTIQVLIPDDEIETYTKRMNQIFGEGSCQEIFIRSVGTTQIIL